MRCLLVFCFTVLYSSAAWISARLSKLAEDRGAYADCPTAARRPPPTWTASLLQSRSFTTHLQRFSLGEVDDQEETAAPATSASEGVAANTTAIPSSPASTTITVAAPSTPASAPPANATQPGAEASASPAPAGSNTTAAQPPQQQLQQQQPEASTTVLSAANETVPATASAAAPAASSTVLPKANGASTTTASPPAAYADMGQGRCRRREEGSGEPMHSFHDRVGTSWCQEHCSEDPDCRGYSVSGYGNCIIWKEADIVGGGGAWGGAHCLVK